MLRGSPAGHPEMHVGWTHTKGVTGMRLRRLIFLSSCFVLALAVLGPVAAHGAAGGTDRPLKGNSVATTTINVVTGVGATDGTSQITHCGSATFHNAFTFTITGPDSFSLVGTDTVVCANGDQLFSTFVITGTLSSSTSTGVFTGTGGTGRFAGASGSFTTVNTSTIISMVGPVITSHDTNTIDGLISY
jgi:hypothetical protein